MPSLDSALVRLRTRLADEGVGAIALTHIPNVRYVTGFASVFDDADGGVALVTATAATVFADSRFIDVVSSAAVGTTWAAELVTGSISTTVAETLAAQGGGRLALESTLPHGRFLEFAKHVPEDVVSAEGWVEELRAVKRPDEISAIEAAQKITDRAFEHMVADVLRPGVSEREIAIDLECFMRREGSDGVAFSSIVASGPNAANPHAKPSSRTLAAGDFVVLDFGARVDGYCADMTRTVIVGTPTSEQRAIYDAVLSSNLAGIDGVAAGLLGCDIDAAARTVIAEAGYGAYFGHGLGHGVGLEVHELPSVGPRGDSPVPLGSVITIEPGIYIPGVGGVRIEDLAVVEEQGARVLSRSTKDLLVV